MTGDIVEVALKRNTSFAVVPCCVFSHMFPSRRTDDGLPVKTYEQLLNYLQQMDDRIEVEELPFAGRSKVVFLREGRAHSGAIEPATTIEYY